MRVPLAACGVALSLVSAVRPVEAQGLHLLPGVEEIESDTIPDLAVATVDQARPAVYWNPIMARRYGPLMTRFFIAHEYGHLYHRHTRARYADLPQAVRDSMLRAQELEADCFAASRDGPDARAATEAVLRYFTRLGPFRFDAEHPTGAQRASRILTCLPSPSPASRLARRDTGVERAPVIGDSERVRFEVRAAALGEARFGSEAILWVDGLRVGRVSNLAFPQVIAVERFAAGLHHYRLTLAAYGLGPPGPPTPDGEAAGRGELFVREGDRFRVDWSPGSAPVLLREEAPAAGDP